MGSKSRLGIKENLSQAFMPMTWWVNVKAGTLYLYVFRTPPALKWDGLCHMMKYRPGKEKCMILLHP
jgi:hypothetical protein